MAKRISPFTDFGFKFIFGQEDNKELLIDFLNTLLADEPGFEKIEDVSYNDKEHPKGPLSERGVIYDIKCTTSSGKFFIVEMQNASQDYFIDRSVYYASRSVVAQARSGKDWNYQYKPVYVVAFLNFTMEVLGESVRTDVALCDLDTHKPVSDKMRFVYIQVPLFKKTEEECIGILDYWLYNIKNMENMKNIAFTQQHRIFQRLESVTNYANLSPEQRLAYDEDLKIYRDFQNCIASSLRRGYNEGHEKGMAQGREEGLEKGLKAGREEGKINTIQQLLNSGMPIETIASALQMSVEEIRNLI